MLVVQAESNNEEDEREVAENPQSRQLLQMSTQHVTAFVLILYALYGICRFGFGCRYRRRRHQQQQQHDSYQQYRYGRRRQRWTRGKTN